MRPERAPWFDIGGDTSAPALSVTSARGIVASRGPSITDSAAESVSLAPGLVAWAEAIVEALRREDRFPSASVLVHDPVAAALRLAAQRRDANEGGEKAGPSWVVPLDGSVCGWVFRMGRPALVGDVSSHAEYFAYPGSATRSELAAPILVGGRTVGVINVESPRPGEFGIDDLERLERRAAAAAESLPSDELPA
jgi:GAF domain-containing protein